MKPNNVFKFLGIMLIVALGVSLTSCSSDDDNDKKDEPNYSVVRVDTYAITPPFVYGLYLFNDPKSKPCIENNWGTGGASFHVYVLQGNIFTDLGTLHSAETSISSADLKKAVHVEVPIPTSIDVSRPYQVVAMDDANSVLSNGRITCDVELKRDSDTYCPSWSVAQGGSSAVSQSNYLAVFEVLKIKNNTGKSIKVKHMGFDTVEKWYCTKGKMSITPSLKMETSVVSTSGEMMSPEKTINAGEESEFESCYVPTGNKMKDARLILEIDGKEVKTPVVSSEISIENGIPYFMRVKWNGTNLEWD